MSIQVLRLAALFYLGSTIAYVVFFARPRHLRLATVGQSLLAVAFVVQGAAIGVACGEYGGTEFFSFRGGIITATWLATGASLVVQRLYRIPTVGAFTTPLVLALILPTLFLHRLDRPEVIPETVRAPALTTHIISASLGVALFALAAAVAIMYLLQEREVKGKRFGALFSRLPPLQSLDLLAGRLVRTGFVVYTIALITGTVVAKAVWKSAWTWDPQQMSSLVIWMLYGGLVQLRHRGWHGRRFALLTIAGFALVVGARTLLSTIPGATRHGGSYK